MMSNDQDDGYIGDDLTLSSPPFSVTLMVEERNGHEESRSVPQRRLSSDGTSMPMLASMSVQNCVGSRTGCFPCTKVATLAMLAMGTQTAVMTAMVSLVAAPQSIMHIGGCVATILAITMLAVMKTSVALTERMMRTCQIGQMYGTAGAVICWIIITYAPLNGPAQVLLTTSLGVVSLLSAQIHLYYFTCASNGTRAHFKTALFLMAAGAICGSSFRFFELPAGLFVGIGAAVVFLVSTRDHGRCLRDTCHYRIGRYAMMHTFSDLGRASLSDISFTFVPNSDILNTHEETVSVLKLAFDLAVFTLMPCISSSLAPVIWGVAKMWVPDAAIWQTPVGTLAAVAAGYFTAVFLSPLATCREGMIAEIMMFIHLIPQFVGCALTFMHFPIGSVMFLAGSVSLAFTGIMCLRRRVADGRLLSAMHLARLVHTVAYASAALCVLVNISYTAK
ncbi:envelope protein UL43 [Spheniscid alphaherpesvirus 1]|uniref:Envelope protein UL43 n=1 Tax=Spheniscid alphaherpesvirus 1 TaxID=2560777 RepID=A0A1R3T1U5_9ALPH|nr:envelope protein UL43 [Spheniscid alphaherpesvirus 1]